MTINELMTARKLLQISYLVTKVIDFKNDSDIINNLDILTSTLMTMDVSTNAYTTRFTKDYKEMKKLYNEVIINVASLIKAFNLENPCEVFAAYVYLYRNGYLSHNKKFIYDTDMKDFPLLKGLDVVRGTGVCRSLAEMLSDILMASGFNSNVCSVNANAIFMEKEHKLCEKEIISSEQGDKYSKIIGKITSKMKLPNHSITSCNDDENSYYFDPTGDSYLHRKGNKLILPNDNSQSIKICSNFDIMPKVFGHERILKVNSKLGEVSNEEYIKMYKKAQQLLKENKDYLEIFYARSKELYDEIYYKSLDKPNQVKRLIPFIQQKK